MATIGRRMASLGLTAHIQFSKIQRSPRRWPSFRRRLLVNCQGLDQRPATQDSVAIHTVVDADEFAPLGVDPTISEALADQNISKPTEIQSMAIQRLINGCDATIASHTGSGKTYAYLIPLVQRLKSEEIVSGVNDGKLLARPHRPRALVVGPSRELTLQILQVTKHMSHFAKFRTAAICGGGSMKPQREKLSTPVDLVVGTPGRILQHVDQGNLYFGDVKFLVLDEADTMFEQGFGEEMKRLIEPIQNLKKSAVERGENPPQLVLVSASFTSKVLKMIQSAFPSISSSLVSTKSLHKSVDTAKHRFITIGPNEDKVTTLAQMLMSRKGQHILVFCNNADSCRAVEYALQEEELGHSIFHYHGAMPAEARIESLERFLEKQSGVLVCTDLAARGLDFNQKVKTVIQFDFPTNPIDYIHRTGRTARANTTGTVISLITKRDRELASRIQEAVENGTPIDDASISKNTNKTTTPKGSQRARQRTEPRTGLSKRGAGRPQVRVSREEKRTRSSVSKSTPKGSRTNRKSESQTKQRQRSTKR